MPRMSVDDKLEKIWKDATVSCSRKCSGEIHESHENSAEIAYLRDKVRTRNRAYSLCFFILLCQAERILPRCKNKILATVNLQMVISNVKC
jgi:hypothetical protein